MLDTEPGIYTPKRILSYVVAEDWGLAPNPDGEYCTLAVCKPRIRQSAIAGQDYILGMGSAKDGQNKVIYVMQVDEKLTLGTYFSDERFRYKKPSPKTNYFGDNFYEEIDGELKQRLNGVKTHDDGNIPSDTGGLYVLISKKFWYFGHNAPELPPHLQTESLALVKNRRGHRVTTDSETISAFLAWLQNYKCGKNGVPIERSSSEEDRPSSSRGCMNCT